MLDSLGEDKRRLSNSEPDKKMNTDADIYCVPVTIVPPLCMNAVLKFCFLCVCVCVVCIHDL